MLPQALITYDVLAMSRLAVASRNVITLKNINNFVPIKVGTIYYYHTLIIITILKFDAAFTLRTV